MDIKRIWSIYFSPTGTTKVVADGICKAIAAKVGGELRTFDFTLPDARKTFPETEKGDVVVFGVPVYAGRVPNLMVDYISQVKGKGAFGVPVVVYGNRAYDDALIELANIMSKGGFCNIAAGAFIGEHSFSRVLAAGRPDEADIALTEDFGSRIGDILADMPASASSDMQNFENVCGVLKIPGNYPPKPHFVPRGEDGKGKDIRKVVPKTHNNCVRCGICAAFCPMGSIDEEDPAKIIGVCIKCGSCIKRCPIEAKYYDDENYLFHKEDLEKKYAGIRREPEMYYCEGGKFDSKSS